MLQLTSKNLKQFRLEQLASQSGKCALCGDKISTRPVVDHDHVTGKVRGILDAQCNWMLGKLERAAKRSGKQNFLKKSIVYLDNKQMDVKYPVKKKRRVKIK